MIKFFGGIFIEVKFILSINIYNILNAMNICNFHALGYNDITFVITQSALLYTQL